MLARTALRSTKQPLLRPSVLLRLNQSFNYSSLPPQPKPQPEIVVEQVVFRRRRHPFRWGMVFGLLGGLAYGLYDNNVISEPQDSLQPPTKCEPFDKTITLEDTQFQCIGVGVRTVSFLKLHVYAVGVYIATDDIPKAKIALTASNANQSNLFDDSESIAIVDALLAAGVRLAIRITPVRNTEFSHLRDGFVRSIMGHPMFKELNDDSFGQGLGELKRAFGRKRKAPKDDTIYMVRTPTGGLDAIYMAKTDEPEKLGGVEDINVTRVFFLQYLSGKNPNSPSARESAVKGLLDLVEVI